MWLFTKYGFFSAVCARHGDGSHGQPVDPSRVMVRARMSEHLESLVERFPAEFGDCEILETNDTDYRFRLFIEKAQWTSVLTGLSDELDYDNFKSKVAQHLGDRGAGYEHALHDVWSVMHGLQK